MHSSFFTDSWLKEECSEKSIKALKKKKQPAQVCNSVFLSPMLTSDVQLLTVSFGFNATLGL